MLVVSTWRHHVGGVYLFAILRHRHQHPHALRGRRALLDRALGHGSANLRVEPSEPPLFRIYIDNTEWIILGGGQ